jgi:NitT/TauT family transport system substrate-binding protein
MQNQSRSRGTFIASLAGVAAATAIPRRRASAQASTIRILTVASDGGALAIYAKEQGFFAKAGLDVDVQTSTSGAAILAALAGGSIDVAESNIGSFAAGVLNGLPFTVIADGSFYLAKKPTVLLCTGKNSTVKTVPDLAGKKIGLNGVRNLTQASVMACLDHHGVDTKTVGFIELPFSEMGEMADAGRVDAVLIAEPALSLARTKLRVIDAPYNYIAPQFSLASYGATTGWVAKNRAVAGRLSTAFRQAAVWANANPQLSGKILVDALKMSDAVVSSMTRCEYASTLDVSNLQSSLDAMAKYGYIAKDIDARTLIASL